MAEEEFDCNKKPGMGVLMEGFGAFIKAFIKPYLEALKIAKGLPASIVPPVPGGPQDGLTVGELKDLLATMLPATALPAGALKMKELVAPLPPMPLPDPLGAMGGLTLPNGEPLPDIIGEKLAGLVGALLIDMLPGMVAGAAGVSLDGITPSGIVTPAPPTFPSGIIDILAPDGVPIIPGLTDVKAVEQLVKCVQETLESSLGDLGPGGGGGEGEGEGEAAGGAGTEEA